MISNLSPIQLEAVCSTEGPVLVFAGAGSGKTRVITHRIAYLINNIKVDPSMILAVTFTNKAAKEMRERVKCLLMNDEKFSEVTVCTFHSLGLKILKQEAGKIGYPPNFTIYSPYEQVELMKKVMEEENISSERFSARTLVELISKMKNNPELSENTSFLLSNIYNSTARKISGTYHRLLKASGAMDFDDLIVLTTQLLQNDKELLEKYSKKFKYILVDEYQDTNHVQFQLIKLLSSHYGNIFVVGDDDQSIYSWRGADIENILNFEKDFKNSKVIKLEENFRSVSEIVNAAGKLILNNKSRAKKNCFTNISGSEDEGIKVVDKLDETSEAEFVAEEIKKSVANNLRLTDTAIIVRANYQTKFFEVSLSRRAIPFSIIGGQKFFENKEIKDILAYIRILINPYDEINLRRIINYPVRGIGVVTLEKFFEAASSLKVPPVTVLKDFEIYSTFFKKEQVSTLYKFVNLYKMLTDSMKKLKPVDFAKTLIREIKIEEEIRKTSESETVARIKLENVRAFIDAVATDPEIKNHEFAMSFFSVFINSITLLQSADENVKSNSVSIITAHSAKGLEFDRVFLTGFYQGGFPNYISIEENNIDEERRLAYVAMTRAKRKLVITIPKAVSFRGNIKNTEPSIFLKEAGLDDEKYSGKPPETDVARMLDAILKKIRE